MQYDIIGDRANLILIPSESEFIKYTKEFTHKAIKRIHSNNLQNIPIFLEDLVQIVSLVTEKFKG
jgi:hypothetical protein